MNSLDRSGARRRWLPRSGHLWVLAAALGALTILAAGSTIHDSGQRRATANLIARMAAEQLTARVASRLEVLSLATFAPVMWPSPGTLVEGAAVDALARAQREGERCRCRETMPASAFFRLGLASDSLDVALAMVGGAETMSRAPIALKPDVALKAATLFATDPAAAMAMLEMPIPAAFSLPS
jgi:hypothetical protein